MKRSCRKGPNLTSIHIQPFFFAPLDTWPLSVSAWGQEGDQAGLAPAFLGLEGQALVHRPRFKVSERGTVFHGCSVVLGLVVSRTVTAKKKVYLSSKLDPRFLRTNLAPFPPLLPPSIATHGWGLSGLITLQPGNEGLATT